MDPMKYEFLDRQGALDLAMGIFSQVNKRIDERIVDNVDPNDDVHVPSSAAVAKAIQHVGPTVEMEPLTDIDKIVEAAYQATEPDL